MTLQRLILTVAMAGCAFAADAPEWQTAELRDVAFDFRLVQDVDEIEQLLGDRLDGDFTLVEVRLRALYGTEVELDRASFVLRSFRGNENSEAQSPDRIGGAGALSMTPGGAPGSGVYTESRENIPLGGGIPTQGQPRRTGGVPTGFGGPAGRRGGSGGLQEVPTAAQEQDMSLHDRLKRLELPLDAGDADVSGYLYFQVDPKHKRKNLSLTYEGRYGEFRVSFEK